MHQFIVDHDEYDASRLLYNQRYETDEYAVLFYVDGPREPYESTFEEVSSVFDYELAPCRDESFYLYVHVREPLTDSVRMYATAFEQPGLIVIPPLEYRSDGTIRLRAIGPDDAIQAAVEDAAERMHVEVQSVGDYRAGRIDARADLTQRQYEAVSVAVDCGYYHATRDASLEDVADRLDCSSGTAGELLRRAERTVMQALVDGGPF
ncbi:helix-turn-helix domain-containing protein [Halopiger goleimassiliensis]|uniref:helix-turn-helix domain-containing protein n=1 Tax=Halopiger goleimassiliensis TaxID=1293048 RepID=UPI001E35177B|nr:helix-turn-helix domain-containing protein [Halopiger goleimassiliensis]